MKDIIIRVFPSGQDKPDATIRIPGPMLRIASKLLPSQAVSPLAQHGIEIERIVELAQDPDVRGTLVEIEEHRRGKRISIALE